MMTITDFFLKQSTKEIKNKFKEINLDKYYNFPDKMKDVCKMFNLEDDKLCDHYFTIKRHSATEVYMYFNLPNPADSKHPIYFKVEYYVKSAKGACSISSSFESHVDIFKKVSTIFDDRKEYNNIEFKVWKQSLPEIFEEKVDEWDERKKYYVLKDSNITPWDYYQAICKYAEGVKPLLDMFVNATENGEFENVWNKLKPHDKWERGHEIMHAMFFPVVMNCYYKAVKAGATPNLEDFVMLFAVSDELSTNTPDKDELQKAFNKISTFNSPNEDIIEGFNYAINNFKQKHLLDDSLKKWNSLYVEANKELLKEVKNIKQKLSQKYNINEEWLRCVCFFRNEKDVKWDSDYIPDNAYAK